MLDTKIKELIHGFFNSTALLTQCLQFRTRSALFLNRFHVLTQQSMDQMQAKRIPISAPEKQQDDKLPATEVNKSITSTGEPVESGNDIEAGKKAAAKKKKGKKRK